MAKIVKVIEVLSESPNSWEEAAKNVVTEANKTLRNIRSVYIKEFTVAVARRMRAPTTAHGEKRNKWRLFRRARLRQRLRGGKQNLRS